MIARMLVTSDSGGTWIEITTDGLSGECHAVCAPCNFTDLVAGTHERWVLEDAIQAASIHLDQHH